MRPPLSGVLGGDVLRPHPWWPPVVLLLGILSGVAEGLGIGLLMPLFQSLGTDGPLRLPYFDGLADLVDLPDGPARTLALAGAILALVLVKGALTYVNGVFYCWMYGRVAHRLRCDSVDRVLAARYADLTSLGSGRVLNTVTGETWRATDALATLFQILVSGVTVLIFLGFLLAISAPLALLVLAGAVAAAAAMRLLTLRATRLGLTAHADNVALFESCTALLDRQRLVRVFGREAAESAQFAAGSETVRRSFLALDRTSCAHGPVQEALYVPIFLGVILAAPSLGGEPAALVPFLLLLYRMQPHLKALDHQRLQLGTLKAATEDVRRLLDLPPAEPGPPVPVLSSGDAVAQPISFHDVGFTYPGTRHPVLDHVDLDLEPGSVTAVVGPSGGGKSTLVALLLRLYEPTTGAILAGDQSARRQSLAAWRARFAAAGQDFDLVAGSIADNIAYGAPDADRAAVEAAAARVGADAFIRALPDGYDTAVGERGTRLSGGQRQRIGLARAVCCRRPVLVLDEPTSALDSEAEALVRDAIRALRGDHTILVISHRLSTVRDADRVLFVEGGRIVEQGSWPSLANGGRRFADYHRLQGLDGPTEPSRRRVGQD